MQGYIIRRIIGAIFVVFLAGTFSFFAIRILPGDAASRRWPRRRIGLR